MCTHGTIKHLKINGRIRDIDSCIFSLVKTLNDNGFTTIASCCGHGHRPGVITLEDGRELIICPDYETAREIDKFIDVDIHGN